MLNISFFLDDDIKDITGYELGGLKVSSDNEIYILENKKYYFMVFLSAIEVLDRTYTFYISKDEEIIFYFSDSSFYIKINKLSKDMIRFYILNEFIGEFSNSDFFNSIYQACNELFLKYKNCMSKNNFFIVDMEASLKDFVSKCDLIN